MKTKITKIMALAFLFFMGMGTFQALTAAGKMKDIELDPGKTNNVGNMLNVFPTIASGEVKIDFFFENAGFTTIRVFDLTGREMEPATTGDITAARTFESILDVSNFNNGIYFIEVSNNGVSLVNKIIVSH